MHCGLRILLVVAALVAGLESSAAQIAVPNVNTGSKSNVPDLSQQKGALAPSRDAAPGDAVRTGPDVPDPRCERLTEAQRRTTPGCHR